MKNIIKIIQSLLVIMVIPIITYFTVVSFQFYNMYDLVTEWKDDCMLVYIDNLKSDKYSNWIIYDQRDSRFWVQEFHIEAEWTNTQETLEAFVDWEYEENWFEVEKKVKLKWLFVSDLDLFLKDPKFNIDMQSQVLVYYFKKEILKKEIIKEI